MTRFTFSLSDRQKQRWEAHLDQTGEHDSMAELIRYSVEKQVEGAVDDNAEARERHNELMYELEGISKSVETNMGMLELVLKDQLSEDQVAELLEMYLERQNEGGSAENRNEGSDD